MTVMLLVELLIVAVLLVCSAFFSSAETALFSLNPIQIHRIKRHRPRHARHIQTMLEVPTQLLSTILIGNTLVNVAAAALGYTIAESLFAPHGEVISIPLMTVLLLVFGEVAPKRLALSWPEKLATHYSPLLRLLTRLMLPFRWGLEKMSSLFTTHLHAADRTLTEDEFLTVVEVGEEEGVLDEEERTMVDGIIRLEETQVSNVMTPRVDLVGIDLNTPPAERERTARSVQFRYLPVYRESLDRPEGFLDVPRFLLADDHRLESAMIAPFFVPETVPLDALLATFQREGKRVAFVVDEFGGTAGLVTRGDILEEIVDDVENEYREEQLTIQKAGANRWFIDGSINLEEVNYELNLNLTAEGADRMAGWVTARAERIPRVGEVVEAQVCRVTVQRVRQHRITLVLLEKLLDAPEEPS